MEDTKINIIYKEFQSNYFLFLAYSGKKDKLSRRFANECYIKYSTIETILNELEEPKEEILKAKEEMRNEYTRSLID